MNILITTTLAFTAVIAAEAETIGVRGANSIPHTLVGAEQLPWLEEHCEGCQPDYCYPKNEEPDYDCYKDGYPRCCSKTRGNCPNTKPETCECDGDCPNGSGSTNRGARCSRNDGTCRGETFCETHWGSCGSDNGRCEVMPTSCNRNIDYVCGCNDKTYDNECEAKSVGVSVKHSGRCDGDSCTLGSDDCGANSYCAVDDGQCMLRNTDVSGQCKPLMGACSANYDPVCGCDGETYSNASCAAARGANVAYEGECTESSDGCYYFGVDDDTCTGDNKYCRIARGDCMKRIERINGACTDTPFACTLENKPVCGCDGETYPNSCSAFGRGVNIMHDGECQ